MHSDETYTPHVIVSGNDPSIKFGKFLADPSPGDEVLITGLSGSYPDSENVHQLRDNLFNKVDMVSDDHRRWKPSHPEIPQRTGKLYNIEKFDAGFFGVHWRQARSLDPMARVLLEQVTAAIFDAGFHPEELEGSRTGVYLGASFSESERSWFYDKLYEETYAVTGCQRSMIPNRVSYFFKFDGPSIVCDTACSSSLFALEQAYKDIRMGIVDQAIVAGTNLCLHPLVSLQFARLGLLSSDGKCKACDYDGRGYVKAETIAAILLQKSNQARRNYCKIVHVKTNSDGFKDSGITCPSGNMQTMLLKELYTECSVNASDVAYLETHGTGTKVGDPEECLSTDNVFTCGRNLPLLIGSVKSNLGHAEPASGMCSITKAIITFETEHIPPNLHFTKARPGLIGLEEGRLTVVTEKSSFSNTKGLIGVNNFGFGGANAHVLLKWNHKDKNNMNEPENNVPRLVCVSGRTVEAVKTLLDDVSSDLDYEHIRLLQDVFKKNIKTHIYRGFTIASKTNEISRSISKYSYNRGTRKLHIFFGNFTNEELKNAMHLLEIPTFKKAFLKIDDILISKNFKIMECISKENLSEIEHFLLNIAIQLSIVDVLKGIELKFDGKAYGNIVSFYANNILNFDETIEFGYKIATTEFIKRRNGNAHCDGDIIIEQKCTSESLRYKENNPRNIIKNSPEDILLTLGKIILPNRTCITLDINIDINIFLKTIGNLYQLGFDLKLHTIYPKVDLPVSRGTKMISPNIKWNHKRTWFVRKYTSDSEMNIREKHIQISLNQANNAFLEGHMVDGRILLPATGYLQLVWDTLAQAEGLVLTDTKVMFENCKFLKACIVPVEDSHKLELTVMIQKGSGSFEVIEKDCAVATGKVKFCENFDEELVEFASVEEEYITEAWSLKTKDIYKELRLRGYNYNGLFKNMESFDINQNIGKLKWENNFMSFMDTMLQAFILQEETRSLYVPTTISTLMVDAEKHLKYASQFGENPLLPVKVSKECGLVRSGFIEIRGLIASSIPRRKYLGAPVLEKYVFVPNITELTVEQSARVNIQIILENTPIFRVKIVELIDETTKENSEVLAPIIAESLSDLPLIQPDITVLSKEAIQIKDIKIEDKKLLTEKDCMLIIGSGLFERVQVLQTAYKSLKKDTGYIISRENLNFNANNIVGVDVLTIHTTKNEKLILFRKQLEYKNPIVQEISLKNRSFSWLPELQEILKNSVDSVLIYSQNESQSGILGLTNCLKKELSGKNIKCLFIPEEDRVVKFNINEPFYLEQLKKNMVVNVLQEGKWGTYRHLLLEKNWEVEKEHAFVESTIRGDLSSIKWIEGRLNKNMEFQPRKELVEIYAASLNFKDVMVASGRINGDAVTRSRLEHGSALGFEYAGKTLSGKRVMGMATQGALSTLVAADKHLLWDIPDKLSLEDAATIPVVYCTCIYALMERGRCKRGDTVLIHSGSGGIGLAAITLTLHLGCIVYTTVGTPEKREYLQKKFSQLSDKNIFNSRTLDFEKDVMRETKGRGVDIVLNSLAEDKMIASVRCLARGGRFLEIGRYDIVSDNKLSTLLFNKEASFHGIMLDAFMSSASSKKQLASIANSLSHLIKEGVIVPLKKNIFKVDCVEEAFRFMTTGKHIGKVLIQVKPENSAEIKTRLLKCLPRFYCDETKSYIICGGLGGFGLELSDWLVIRGVRNLIITSRSGIKNAYQNYRINIWKSYGCHVKICTQDITTFEGCKSLLTEASNVAPIKAIFNLAVVLKDAILDNQTEETFNITFAPKAFATEYLDHLSRKLCPELSHFVIFSSVSCGRGNAGQTNYGMANSVIERICERRKIAGYPALAIEWGAVGDVGLVAEKQDGQGDLAIGGTIPQKISSCLDVMDVLLSQNESSVVSSMVVAEKKGGLSEGDTIVGTVASILGIKDIKTISKHATLAEVGMDSMIAVEIKQTLEREFEVCFSAQDIKTLTFARLEEIRDDFVARNDNEKKENSIGGLNMILGIIGDECTANISSISMRSKPTEKEILKKIVFFPGIEGCAKAFEPLTSKLEGILICIQYCSNKKDESIEQIAKSCFQYVEEIYNIGEEFTIVGHSFGGLVALEVVKMLEQNGYTGKLLIIDASPVYVKTLIKNIQTDREDMFQTNFFMFCLSIILSHDKILPHMQSLYNCGSIEERINLCHSILGENTPFSKEYQRQLAESIYRRIKAIASYEHKFKLRTEVNLFKSEFPSVEVSSEDYFLSEYAEMPVVTRTFKGTHVSILGNESMADFINKLVNI